MYVCVCNAVTEKQVQQAIDNGAVTVARLQEELHVGTRCGACGDCLRACLSRRLAIPASLRGQAPADDAAGCAA